MNRAIALLLCCLPLAASADIYKWVDDKGQVHYSQNPPAQGHYEDVTPQLPMSGTTTGGSRPAGRSAAASGNADDRAAQQALQSKADNAERCAKAREQISYLQEKTAHRLFVTGEDGQPARMTDEQFNQELQDAQAAASKYCD
ncbi:MAG: DUF4124 domain-containing protein [Nevskia sp.]|nr:DUF4124 domain-containing protein [Nevskia sp.]